MRHPLHPAIVHFPVACWSLATCADIASLWLGQPAWWLAGVLLVIGTAAALIAAITGMLELVRVPDGAALRAVHRHAGAAMTSWLLYGTSLLLRMEGMSLAAPGRAALLASVLGFTSLALTGWLGGTLVYRHGLGRDVANR